GPLLRLLRAPRRALGDRPPPADLREGSLGSGRAGRAAPPRPCAARALPGRLPPPRLSTDEGGVRRAARLARFTRARRREALRGRTRVARGLADGRRAALTSAARRHQCGLR